MQLSLPLFAVKFVLRRVQKKAKWDNIALMRRAMDRLIHRFVKWDKELIHKKVRIGEMDALWLSYKESNDKKVLLYFHGGGYAAGSTYTHVGLASEIIKSSKTKALLIDYRLSPENKYPAPVEDAVAAYEWLLNKGYEPKNIAFGGDSAGGGLTLASLLYLIDKKVPLPACAVCLSPWLDLTMSGSSFQTKQREDPMLIAEGIYHYANLYCSGGEWHDRYASPVLSDLKGLPPIYVQVGSAELLYSDSERLYNFGKAAKVDVKIDVYDGYFHVFQAFYVVLSKARTANKKLGEYIARRLNETIES